MLVVSNTTPIISLAAIKKINLLRELFGYIYIPKL
jgi:predicted nucleic acid-binding protein